MERLKSSSNTSAQYGLAAVAVVAALLISELLQPLIPGLRYLVFILAIEVSAWYGGWWPGMFAISVSLILISAFLSDPPFSILSDPQNIPPMILFIGITVIIAMLEQARIRAQEALRESRDQLNMILRGISDGVTAVKPNGQIAFANQAAAQLNGFSSADEMVQTPVMAVRQRFEWRGEDGNELPLNDLPTLQALNQKKSTTHTLQMHDPTTGENRWVVSTSTPLLDERGDLLQVINIFRDVSERKMAELEMRNQRERLSTMLASINNGVIAVDSEGRVELVNPQAEVLSGWKQVDAVGKPFEDLFKFITETDHTPLEDPVKEALREGKPLDRSNNTLLINRDGKNLPVDMNAAPVKDEHNETAGAILVFRDVTERRNSSQELMRLTLLLDAQRRRLQNILYNIPGIVWETSVMADGVTQHLDFINNYVEKVLGYTVEEWVANPTLGTDILHPDDRESVAQQASEQYGKGLSTLLMQYRLIAKDGRVVPIEANLTILKDEAGKVIGTCGLLMDITQRKEAENALAQYALDLRRSNEQLEQFAYVASHDLQEPLRMITSYLQLLERRYKDKIDEDASQFISYAVDGATRMKYLINDLLTYSRVNTVERNFAAFESAEALQTALDNLQVSVKEEDARIHFDKLPKIMGNEGQFIQLFQNLISNALKFRGQAPPEIHVEAVRKKDEWVFSVSDNGIGIEKEYLDRIFIIFQRLHNKETYPGTGIGLAICKKVVEHHGGRIWVESQPGVGTTFFFTIPVLNQ